MNKPLSLFLMAVYSIAFAWSAFERQNAFTFLILAGIIASIPIILQALLRGIGIMIVVGFLGFLATIFPFLLILYAIALIAVLIDKLKNLFINGFIILIGIAMYAALYYIPGELSLQIIESVGQTGMVILLLLMGFLAIYLTVYLLKMAGIPEEKAALFVIGLPAFFFLIVFAIRSGGIGSDSGDANG